MTNNRCIKSELNLKPNHPGIRMLNLKIIRSFCECTNLLQADDVIKRSRVIHNRIDSRSVIRALRWIFLIKTATSLSLASEDQYIFKIYFRFRRQYFYIVSLDTLSAFFGSSILGHRPRQAHRL